MIDIDSKPKRNFENCVPQEGNDLVSGPPALVRLCIQRNGFKYTGLPEGISDSGGNGRMNRNDERGSRTNRARNPRRQVAKDLRSRCLIRTALGDGPSNDNEKEEKEAERGDGNDNRCDSDVDFPEVAGKGTTKKQQRTLHHQGQRLHHMVKVPRDNAI